MYIRDIYVCSCFDNMKFYLSLSLPKTKQKKVWLDPTRSILKQVKNLNPIIFCFRVKFYPANPILLKDELTRYYLYLQLRRDLLNRRLYCLPADAIYLMACVVQCMCLFIHYNWNFFFEIL